MKESKINIVDLLLAQDASKIRDLPTAQIRITRLSDIIGADFCLEIRRGNRVHARRHGGYRPKNSDGSQKF